MKPFFSIIITTYNRKGFIAKAIQSVVIQTYTNWELIIVDDGSTDGTEIAIQEFLSDNRIQYHWKENEERCVARNYGAYLSKGKFLFFLDSDDYYLPTHLESFFKVIDENNGKDALYFSTIITKLTNGVELYKDYSVMVSNNHANNITNFGVVMAPPILAMTVSRSIFNKVKYSEQWLPFNEHYHFTLEVLIKNIKPIQVKQRTAVVLLHQDNTTNCVQEPIKFSIERIRFIRWALKHYKLSKTRELSDYYTGIIYDCILRSDKLSDIIKYFKLLITYSLNVVCKRRFYSVVLFKMKRNIL